MNKVLEFIKNEFLKEDNFEGSDLDQSEEMNKLLMDQQEESKEEKSEIDEQLKKLNTEEDPESKLKRQIIYPAIKFG